MQYMNNIVTKKRNKEIEISGKKSKKKKHTDCHRTTTILLCHYWQLGNLSVFCELQSIYN
jgi:hypothetical protein